MDWLNGSRCIRVVSDGKTACNISSTDEVCMYIASLANPSWELLILFTHTEHVSPFFSSLPTFQKKIILFFPIATGRLGIGTSYKSGRKAMDEIATGGDNPQHLYTVVSSGAYIWWLVWALPCHAIQPRRQG